MFDNLKRKLSQISRTSQKSVEPPLQLPKDRVVFIVGLHNSGKTTFQKAIKFNCSKLNTNEMLYKLDVLIEVCRYIQLLLPLLPPDSKEVSNFNNTVTDASSHNFLYIFGTTLRELIVQLYHETRRNPNFEETVSQLEGNYRYFVGERLNDICAKTYVPSTLDMILTKSSTIKSMNIKISNYDYQFIDMGSSTIEFNSKSWKNKKLFAVIMTVDLCNYVNWFQKELNLFGELCNQESIKDAPLCIFFTKKSAFFELLGCDNSVNRTLEVNLLKTDPLDCLTNLFAKYRHNRRRVKCYFIEMFRQKDFIDDFYQFEKDMEAIARGL